jgi:hypothetical protein
MDPIRWQTKMYGPETINFDFNRSGVSCAKKSLSEHRQLHLYVCLYLQLKYTCEW